MNEKQLREKRDQELIEILNEVRVALAGASVLFGFLLQWPTLLTLLMFPVLVTMYLRLARAEEREALAEFGDAYSRYMAEVPAFVPKLSLVAGRGPGGGRQYP